MSFFTAYGISLFYILNPFSAYHLQGLMFWNVAPLFVLPLVFGCIYLYYLDTKKLFLYFGVLSALFAFSVSNIPYLGIFEIFLVISVVVIPFIRDIPWKLKTVIRNFFILELSFLLFNAWWFINLVRFQMQDVALYYTKGFAVGWAQSGVGVGGIMGKIFSLKTLISFDKGSYFSDIYNSVPFVTILVLPFVGVISYFLKKAPENDTKSRKPIIALVASLLLIFFLSKGANEPLGKVFIWMLQHIPLFSIFKTPLEKFSVLLVFLLALTLALIFRSTKSGWFRGAVFAYVIACSIPYATLRFMPEYGFETGSNGMQDKYISKKYTYKEGYFAAAELLNHQKLNYRALSLPGSVNYQVTLLNHDGNKYYRGMDPFIYSVNKPFITAYSEPSVGFFDPIFNNISNASIGEIFNIYNLKQVVFNHDIYPSFGTFREDWYAKEPVFKSLVRSFEKNTFGSVDVFSKKDVLPLLYVPQSIIISSASMNALSKIVSAPTYRTRSAIFFTDQNSTRVNEYIHGLVDGKTTPAHLPILEYKKINPTKYRIVIHHAQGLTPIVFSERFHGGWKLYAKSPEYSDFVNQQDANRQLENYVMLDGNSDDQSTKDELIDYWNRGWISTLGDPIVKTIQHWKWSNNTRQLEYIERYVVDFISKNFYGTIQNDNLPGGVFYETLFRRSIEDSVEHATVNGYANSWILDIEAICSSDGVCRQNADGTQDIEIIMEFWPQRLFYIGGAVSVTAFLCGLGCLMYKRRHIKMGKN